MNHLEREEPGKKMGSFERNAEHTGDFFTIFVRRSLSLVKHLVQLISQWIDLCTATRNSFIAVGKPAECRRIIIAIRRKLRIPLRLCNVARSLAGGRGGLLYGDLRNELREREELLRELSSCRHAAHAAPALNYFHRTEVAVCNGNRQFMAAYAPKLQ